MAEQLILNNLKIEKAKEEDWGNILKLLDETSLTFWFTGNESFNNFYIVKEPQNNNLICTFAIECENEIGVLKSFAIPKGLQGKGIGKYLANKTPLVAKELGIKKLYAVSQEAPEFWQKTKFREIKLEDAKDNYFINYLSLFCHRIPDYYNKTHYFLALI